MLLERVPETVLSDAEAAASVLCATYDPNTDWQAWARGRVFCSTWELRWEEGRASYLGAPTPLPGFEEGPSLDGCSRREHSYYLWGSRDRKDPRRFTALQIPRVLSYPVDTGRQVKLHVAEWVDHDGLLVAWRCLRLEGVA
ncbi:MAG: hypothetical protein GX774_17645 [Armatimonadetes bacterium]|jgi:hypothetical protein|nr:hypothetical protein [Armatimonadota bacterium]